MLEFFLNVPPLSCLPKKKTMKFVQKENFQPKIKRMIENLQNELYELGNKQVKGA